MGHITSAHTPLSKTPDAARPFSLMALTVTLPPSVNSERAKIPPWTKAGTSVLGVLRVLRPSGLSTDDGETRPQTEHG
jgi:hypothetical protein